MAAEVDIPGFNYSPMHYEQILKEHPDWIIFGSETASCVSSRGVYHLPIVAFENPRSLQVSSYDTVAPEWAMCPDVEFTYQDKFPQVLGEFVWTGFDYIGEPTPFWGWQDKNPQDWPSRSSYFGFIDLAGFPKDRYYLYQSQWTTKPMVHLLPHWNWEGKEGQAIPGDGLLQRRAKSSYSSTASRLARRRASPIRGRCPSRQNVSETGKFVTKYRRIWQVPYEPGTLKGSGVSERQASRDGGSAYCRRTSQGETGGGPRRDPSRWRRPFVCHRADRRPAREPVSHGR